MRTLLLKQVTQSDKKLPYHKQGIFTGIWDGYGITFDDIQQRSIMTKDGVRGKVRVLVKIIFNDFAQVYEM